MEELNIDIISNIINNRIQNILYDDTIHVRDKIERFKEIEIIMQQIMLRKEVMEKYNELSQS
jgi:hypothetical protein